MPKAHFLLAWPNKNPKRLFSASLQFCTYMFFSEDIYFLTCWVCCMQKISYFYASFYENCALVLFYPGQACSDTININSRAVLCNVNCIFKIGMILTKMQHQHCIYLFCENCTLMASTPQFLSRLCI